MKPLLAIMPPFWPKTPPLGIGYLQAFLAKNNIDCDILDLNNIFYNLASGGLKKSWLVSCNAFLEENIFDLIQKNYPEEFKKVIDKILGYEIAGFSCFKSNIHSTLRLARLLKSRNRDIKIIFGGPEIARQFFKAPGRFPEDIKNTADFIIAGEGEKSLLDLVQLRKLDKLRIFDELSSLNDLPFPVYKGVDINLYPRKK